MAHRELRFLERRAAKGTTLVSLACEAVLGASIFSFSHNVFSPITFFLLSANSLSPKFCLLACFRLFVDCASERRPQRTVSFTGDGARIQDETTESSAWFLNVLGVKHRHTEPRFQSLIRKTISIC